MAKPGAQVEDHALDYGDFEGGTGGGAKPRSLLIKRDDEEADARRNPVGSHPESVKTGHTIEQVAATR